VEKEMVRLALISTEFPKVALIKLPIRSPKESARVSHEADTSADSGMIARKLKSDTRRVCHSKQPATMPRGRKTQSTFAPRPDASNRLLLWYTYAEDRE
jgi:hypothetical protein